jgi:hypothetical protein
MQKWALILLFMAGSQVFVSAAPNSVAKPDQLLLKKSTSAWLKASHADKAWVGLSLIGALELKKAYKGPKNKRIAAKKITDCIDYIAKGLIKKKIKPAIVAEVGFLCAINEGFVKK